MSSATAVPNDTLPSSIPKLDASCVNWAIFKVRFQDAVEAKGLWDHYDGSSTCPVLPPVVAVTAPASGTTPATITQSSPTAAEIAAQQKWDKEELSAKYMLTQKIPDSTLMRVHAKRTVRERWEAIVAEYTEKGAYAQTDLRTKFLESKCPEKTNIREFLDNLRVKREELASVGVDIDEKDYHSVIISSLPVSLSNFASNLLASAQMFSSTKTLAPDVLISLISEESEQQKAQRSRRSGKSKDDEKDEALSVGASSKAKSTGAKRDSKKPRGICWNCGEKGHFKPQCPKPPKSEKSSDNSAGKKKAGDVHAVLETDSDSDGVHAVFVDTDSETDSMPGLQSVSNTETGSMPGLQSVTRSLCSDLGGAGEAEDGAMPGTLTTRIGTLLSCWERSTRPRRL
ncbi:hypothetical protein D9619_009265 [Psilocybe cf. subviscida]|uniref:CCHC-type domain-containing protein n=1 Tax=Psilocybe cf. subviscida TaxID=2480587 RepID=A0A8H5BW55_9AGAR|nr:hypothetical protein D9619_009265 [Psilocybe cf. subviscida]